jgi:hypothetical protein
VGLSTEQERFYQRLASLSGSPVATVAQQLRMTPEDFTRA